jgi:hypothetical protein
MKEVRKLVALIIVITMMLSISTSALASGDPNTVTVTGTGGIVYVDTTRYIVTLPTSAEWDFTLDPQGLVGLEPGQTVPQADLEGAAGRIVAGAAAPTIINRSSVPITLTASITPTAAAGSGVAPTLVTTVAAVDTGTNMNVLLTVVSSAINVNDPAPAPFEGTHAVPLAVSGTAQSFTYLLDGADYQYTNIAGDISFERIPTSNGNGTSLQLAGFVNKDADWSNFGSLGVTAVFSFSRATAGEISGFDATKVDEAFGLFGSYTTVSGVEVVTPGSIVGTGPTGFIGVTVPDTASRITLTAAVNDFIIPFRFNNLTVRAVDNIPLATGVASPFPQAGTSNRYSVTGAGTVSGHFVITLINTSARTVRITLSNNSVYNIVFNAP